MTTFDIKGKFTVEIRRNDGTIEREEFSNLVTNEGKIYLLRAGISGESTAISSWFMGLIGANITPSNQDTASAALGTNGIYGEITSYTAPTRPQYQCAFSASPTPQINNNNNAAEFLFTAPVTIRGVFIVSSSAKGSNTGVLMCAGLFSSPKSLAINESLIVKYAITV